MAPADEPLTDGIAFADAVRTWTDVQVLTELAHAEAGYQIKRAAYFALAGGELTYQATRNAWIAAQTRRLVLVIEQRHRDTNKAVG